MTMDRHVEFADKLEAYLLGQLSEQEIRDIEIHLRACATCARDVHELQAVFTGIGESAPPVPTSPALRERVLTAVALEAQEPVRAARQLSVVRQPRPVWSLVSLAAAAVLILAVGAMALRSERARRALADDLSRVQAVNDDLRKRVERFGGQTDLALSILTAGDMREIPMTGSEAAANAAARAMARTQPGGDVVGPFLCAPIAQNGAALVIFAHGPRLSFQSNLEFST